MARRGLPQLASTLESLDDGARAGAPPADHLRELRGSQWVPFDRLLGDADLGGWSSLDREILEAESWALCHYLTFGGNPKVVPDGALERYRARIGEGVEPGVVARAEFGDLGKLQHEVWRVIRGEDLSEGDLGIQWPGAKPETRAVPTQEVLEQLGGLAIAIGKQKLAAGYLEAARELGAGSARSLASWGDLLESNGDSKGADARYQAALAAAPDDPLIHVRFANSCARVPRAAATPRSGPTSRGSRAPTTRAASNCMAGLAESHAGLAATYLVDGEDPSGTLEHARFARTLLPGDAEVGLLSARLELAIGDREAARHAATREMTRARSAPDLAAARSVLAQIDERASIR